MTFIHEAMKFPKFKQKSLQLQHNLYRHQTKRSMIMIGMLLMNTIHCGQMSMTN